MSGGRYATVAGPGDLALRAAFIGYLALLVALPLAALLHTAWAGGAGVFWAAISTSTAADAVTLALWTAALVSIANAVMGTMTAWVLVRCRFPGRAALSAIVDLPLAIPTLVAGIMLVLLFGPRALAGRALEAAGITVLYAPPAIVLALLLITVPSVVRAVEPVLLQLDPAEEEAAHTLGASAWMTFARVVLPALTPAITYGALQSFARALAEFGSIVVVSGNVPHRTLTAAVFVFGEVESGHPDVAAAVSVVLLGLAFALSLTMRSYRPHGGRRG